jgi:6-phosphogluconolactonase (cycloisomerase 2 family)
MVEYVRKRARNFTIDPSGNYLLIGQQQTNEVVIFKRDQGNGTLTDTGKTNSRRRTSLFNIL